MAHLKRSDSIETFECRDMNLEHTVITQVKNDGRLRVERRGKMTKMYGKDNHELKALYEKSQIC